VCRLFLICDVDDGRDEFCELDGFNDVVLEAGAEDNGTIFKAGIGRLGILPNPPLGIPREDTRF
jgi:hypothetical protein